MSGKLDHNPQLTVCADAKIDEKINTHIQLASQVGLRGTPLLYIKGQVIDGFDRPVIEKLLQD
jgi:protein-disulfide isomerase